MSKRKNKVVMADLPPINEAAQSCSRQSIEELEALLAADDQREITIHPDGRITAGEEKREGLKPLTMRENLGGEYGAHA